jgi:hypothetical protein
MIATTSTAVKQTQEVKISEKTKQQVISEKTKQRCMLPNFFPADVSGRKDIGKSPLRS